MNVMHLFEKNIKDLGLNIPEPPSAVANYVPYKIVDNLVFISGQAPSRNGKLIYTGKVGDKITDEEGILAAELCCLNIISLLKKSIEGDWEKFDNFVKIGGFVNCNPNYSNQPIIINGASDLLVKIFGDKGRHTRVAVGSNSLPLDISVEIDAIIKIK
tara:strand:+ start:176 stop:649 length:474 start_codon:yes stop_codon:yes gene_type:complete